MTAFDSIKAFVVVCILDASIGGAVAQQAGSSGNLRTEAVFPILRASDTQLDEALDGDIADVAGDADISRRAPDGLRIPANLLDPNAEDVILPPPFLPGAAVATAELPDEDLDTPDAPLRPGYAPLGIRAGGFIVHPAIETGLQYTDNALLSETGRKGDLVYSVAPELRVLSDWTRHSASLSLSSNHEFYQDNTSQDANEIQARAAVLVDVSAATKGNLEGGYSFAQEETGTAETPDNVAEKSNETSWDVAAWISHRFNRLTATLRGGLGINEFGDASGAGGGNRDYHETVTSLRLGYEISPTLQPFVETGYSLRRHDSEVDDNGFRRDSDGYSVAAGVAVNTGPILRGEASFGYETREFDDPALATIDDVTFNANLTWAPTELTTVRFDAGTDINETSVNGASGSLERSLGFGLSHSFALNVTGDFGVTYVNTTYRGADIEEQNIGITAGLDYLVNRNLVVRAGYEYTGFETTRTAGDYDINTVKIGVRLQQ